MSKLIGTAVFLVACCFIAQADMVTFVTPAGSMTGGQPVDASAMFTTGAGTITVLLTNLEANPTSVVQALSDLDFTLSNGVATGAAFAPTGNSSQEITVNGNGTFSLGPALTTASAIGWPLTVPTAQSIDLDVLGAGGAGPAHLIKGPPGGGGTYSNADGSIAGNGPHNPFLNQSATWVIGAPNVSAGTTVSAATFSFGTTEGANLVPGIPSAVPEPGFYGVLALGVGALFMAIRRQRRMASSGN